MGPKVARPLSCCFPLFVLFPSAAGSSSGLPSLLCALPTAQRDIGQLATNAGRENAREERGFSGLDGQPVHQELPSSPPVQPSLGTEDDVPGSHYQVCKTKGPYQILEPCPR